MRHLCAEPACAHLAICAHALARLGGALELLELAAVEVEKSQYHAVGVDDQLAARAEGDLGALYRSLDQHWLAGRRVLRIGERRFVLIAQRQVEHEVEPRAQPELFERLRGFIPRGGWRQFPRARRAAAPPRRLRRAPDRVRVRTAP